MKPGQPSRLAEVTGVRLAVPQGGIAGLEGEDGRLLGAFDHLQQAMEQLFAADLDQQGTAMRTLTQFFRADAAGLYVTPQPGRAMELLTAHQFPVSAPFQLRANMLDGESGRPFSVIRAYIPDVGSSVWAEAAQDAGWQDVLVYVLPRCSAKLVLAYTGPFSQLEPALVGISLRSLATAVHHRDALRQVDSLRQLNQELDHRFKGSINHLTEGVVVLDCKGEVVFCSQPGGQLLGYAPDEVVGLPVDGVLVSRGDIGQVVQRVLSGRSSLETRQLVLYQRSGDPFTAGLRVVPLRGVGHPGARGAMVFFVEQQTDQMEQMENGLRQKNAQLERMISILAHEIRNPLGSIKAGLDYLEPALSHDESILQDLNTIQGEIRRMDRLLEDALLVSRPSELKTRPQSITDLLDHLLAGRAKLLEERGVTVRKKYEPDLPRIPLDRVQMEQVFDNLIINAMHAMTGGGHLTVTAAVIGASSSDSSDSRPVLQVEVGDSGPGIPPEKLERIFDPFFTTKKGGTGLGLAVARRIVGQHNGTLKANSWLGIGTIFVITLPVEDELLE